MGHRRIILPDHFASGDALTRDLVSIGFKLEVRSRTEANIEDTLIAASIAGMEHDDLRVLALLSTWLGIHQERINADRLCRVIPRIGAPRAQVYWAAIASWHSGDPRLKRLALPGSPARVHLLRIGSEFQLARRGEDPRFAAGPLIVPAGVLRDRAADVLTPSVLATRHTAYRHRVQMGASYRADMWAALSQNPRLTPSQLATATYGSFATAWQVKRDFALIGAA